MTPRWFYVVLAVCAIALTVAAIAALRWEPTSDGHVLDTWKGELCFRRAYELLCPGE